MNDPIRIVPLHLPIELYRPSAGIAVPPAAQLVYRGGPLLDSIKVFTIFWGKAWQTTPNSSLANQVNQFFKFVVSSALIDQLAEYSVPGQPIGHGSFIGTVTITTPALSQSITDPVPGQGWYDDTHGEIGDICAWQTKKLGNYTVQLEWSNKNASCK